MNNPKTVEDIKQAVKTHINRFTVDVESILKIGILKEINDLERYVDRSDPVVLEQLDGLKSFYGGCQVFIITKSPSQHWTD